MLCLGIESSCDETALALYDENMQYAIMATQIDMHALFGGVVPELASREHLRLIAPIFDELLLRSNTTIQDIELISVARGPGLLGSLLCGMAFAKSLALARQIDLIGVNHLHAHILAAEIENEVSYPAFALLVSGGHTHIYYKESSLDFELVGKSLDDAAGEALDKFAKMLGLAYPGGAIIDALAKQGQADSKLFTRPYLNNDNFDFSFSGLKTAAQTYIQKADDPSLFWGKGKSSYIKNILSEAPKSLCDLCASYLEAIADTLTLKLEKAILKYQKTPKSLILAGGVAANSLIRKKISKLANNYNLEIFIPSPKLCTDNGMMIAYTGHKYYLNGYKHDLSLSAIPRGQSIPHDYIKLKG